MNPVEYAADLSRGLAELRDYAEARMTSRVNVWRRFDLATQNEETGEQAIDWAAVYVDHPFELQNGGSNTGGSRSVTVGGVVFEQATAIGALPADTLDLADGDLIEIVSGDWADSVYSIVEAIKKTTRKSRRLPIVEADRPEEWL